MPPRRDRKDVYPIGKKNPNLPFQSGRARRRLHLRLGPGGQGRRQQHVATARSRKRPPARLKRSGGFLPKKARRSRTSCGSRPISRIPRDFGRYNKVFAEHFKDAVLARTTVEARAVISTKIEMDAIAYKPRGS